MTSERWQQINRIYDAALEVAETERPVFVREACHGDEELRREVESLLAYDKQAQQFIDRPALQITAEKLATEPPSLVGRQLGPYQIQGVLGAGGMGEVYKARDMRLNRAVAIKVLPRHLSERADLRQRFEREARAIASLDHSHICALYDIGHEGETTFLVMQYLEGETLSQRLRKGPLPTEEVLRYSIEIAGALEQAHRKGVVHRDLKPGNIMLTETGAKLLDFGLAKIGGTRAWDRRSPSRVSERAQSSRSTQSLTEEGMILGTLEYMAPEQLEGKEADARTDLFALGVVIYEMATGQKAFEGDSKASVIAKILTAQPPPMTTIEPVTPPELDRLVQRCLAKKPEERWQTAAELTAELQETTESVLPKPNKARKREKESSGEAKEAESGAAAPAAIAEPPRLVSRLIRSPIWKVSLVGMLVALTVGTLVLWRVWQRPKVPRKEMSVKPLTAYSVENPIESAAISPDGKYLAFCSNGKLFRQIVQSGEKRSLDLPEGFYAAAVVWFPDETKLLVSRTEERWTTIKGQLTRFPDRSLWSLSILGGAPHKIVDHAEFPGGFHPDGSSVSPDGSQIAFHRFEPERETVELWVVGASGEGPRRVRAPSPAPQDHDGYFGPVWSSNGQRLFYIRDLNGARWIESCELQGDHVTRIFPTKDGQKYLHGWEVLHSLLWVPDGRLLFSMQETGPFNLWEIKVDAATGLPLSEAQRLTQWVGFQTTRADSLSMTADGKQLVVLRGNLQGDVYVAEAEDNGKSMRNPRRLTFNETDDAIGSWTPDSRSVLFSSSRNRIDNMDIFKQNIAQTDAEPIVATRQNEWHPSFSPDGTLILYLVSEKANRVPWDSSMEPRLMRAPVAGGPPEVVLSGEKIRNFSCASEANLCVVVEEMEGKQILTTFDPLKGRGERLPGSDYPRFGRGILSPQGKIVEKVKSGPDGLYIRVGSLPKGPTQEITFKNLTSTYQFFGWSLDGRGIYLYTGAPLRGTTVYAGLNGETHILWKRGSGPGFWFDYPVPSPDGRYLAFTLGTYESNAWILENF
jgi:eukaryotic-like serine/threonine-protein kinase